MGKPDPILHDGQPRQAVVDVLGKLEELGLVSLGEASTLWRRVLPDRNDRVLWTRRFGRNGGSQQQRYCEYGYPRPDHTDNDPTEARSAQNLVLHDLLRIHSDRVDAPPVLVPRVFDVGPRHLGIRPVLVVHQREASMLS